MNCPYCGKETENGQAFCINCGQSLGNSDFVYSDVPSEKDGKKSSGKGSKKAIVAIIAVLSVLLLALAAVIVLEVTDVIDIGAIFTKEDDTDNDSDKIEKETEAETEESSKAEESTSENNTAAPSIPDSGVYYDKIKVGTGGINGTYYALTSALCNAIWNDDYSFEVVSTGGSAANINGINDGTYQMAICQNDVINYAYNGENGFDSPVRGFSAIGCIYPEICQIITTEDSGIYSIEDLRGKTVAIGDVGSGVYYNAVQILEAAGIDPENDIIAVYLSFGDSVTSLKEGSIDAAFITAGVPTTAVTELATSTKTVALSLPEDVVEELIREYPYYTEYTLTSEDYDFITSPVSTVCIKAAYVVTNDMSEQQVYEITKALWEDPDVRTSHAKAEEMDIYTTLAGIGSVPLHPGAAKYYKEMGLHVENVPSFEKEPEIVDIPLTEEEYAIGVDINQPELLEDVNAFLEKIKSDGTLDEICNHYLGDGTPVPVESAALDESKDQLVVATNAVFEPFEYKEGDKFLGIDMEIAALLADYLGKELVISDMYFDAVCLSVSQGKADIAIAGLTVKPEREEYVTFSDIYYDCSQVLIISSDDKSFDKCVTADDVIAVLDKFGSDITIGVQSGTTSELFVKGDEEMDFIGFAADCRTYRNCALALKDMLDGNINYVITDRSTAYSIIE